MPAASLIGRFLLAVWLALGVGQALAEVAVPPLKARVTDLTGTLTAQQAGELESLLRDFEARKGSQIAVLMLPTTQPESIEQYALRVAEQWKLGRKGVDDGALLLVAKQDRALRLEVGYGLEGALPDAVAKRIVSEVITPYFKQGDFNGGLRAGVQRAIRVIEGEPLPPPAGSRASVTTGVNFFEDTLPVAMLFIFVVGGLLRTFLGRFLGGVVAGGVSFLGAWLLLGSFLAALAIALVVALITISGSGRGGPFVGGGGFGGGGGFSGGGGGFGGGGASGRW